MQVLGVASGTAICDMLGSSHILATALSLIVEPHFDPLSFLASLVALLLVNIHQQINRQRHNGATHASSAPFLLQRKCVDVDTCRGCTNLLNLLVLPPTRDNDSSSWPLIRGCGQMEDLEVDLSIAWNCWHQEMVL